MFSGTSKLKERASLYYKLARSFVIKQSSCALCGRSCHQIPMLCRYCYQDLARFDYQYINHNLLNWPAIAKAVKHKYIDRLVCIAPYQWPLKQWIAKLKYHRQSHYGCLLGNLITPFIKRHLLFNGYNNALLMPVPISTAKWCQRQYNQCHLIAKQVKRRIPSIDYRPDLLTHVGNNTSQVGKSGPARRSAFNPIKLMNKSEIKNRDIIVLDDVFTTGNTANNIARLLKRNGARRVAVVTIALSLPD